MGHASNVRTALLNREWGQLTDDGLCLRAPSDVLDAWKVAYTAPVSERLAFYTTLHGSLLESRVKDFFDLIPNDAQTALGSFSAAEWMAPYGRTNTLFLWSQQKDVEEIRQRFQLSPSSKGENVVVGIEHSSCGGCHMKLQAQILVSCRAQGEIVTCPSCGRILYFTSDMSLTPGD